MTVANKNSKPCDYCKRAKRACRSGDTGGTCVQCEKRGTECTFSAPSERSFKELSSVQPTSEEDSAQWQMKPIHGFRTTSAHPKPSQMYEDMRILRNEHEALRNRYETLRYESELRQMEYARLSSEHEQKRREIELLMRELETARAV